ncbi:Cysteine sulfinic acid decarboxylase [Holothuria leucospilota]|uniref:Cysteine sulfinic acid decarboxylase n=1 Tax=Holothuria leucospilota TaxID=206669 RepID=A0A9Q1BZK0_HOLLE|nr:Cysteine sulfinic acid decarboxylase [Holothuria leucospilota]
MYNGCSTGGFGNSALSLEEQEKFWKETFDLIWREGIVGAQDESRKVVEFKQPQELRKCLNLELKEDGEDTEKIIGHFKQAFQYSVKTAHPYFFNQLYGPQDTFGLSGQMVADSLNASNYTFEVSPVFTLVEEEVLRRMRMLCGFKQGDGIFCPGGSIANMYAMTLARYSAQADIQKTGMFAQNPMKIFTTELCHFSVVKGACFLGFGSNNVVLIKTDESGKMIPEELDREIQTCKDKGETPVIVIATSGTTVFGAYDPLNDIWEVCHKHNVWFHVDAAWGGGALLSRLEKHKLNGIHLADSVTWCPHKLLGAPLQCSALLLNNKGNILKDCMSAKAKYLYQDDKCYDVTFDTGDKSLQCSRLVDAYKIWVMWKAKGDKGFEVEIDNKFDCARYLAEQLKQREGFQLLLEPECTNVCFWFIPPCLRGKENEPDFYQRLSKVAPIIKAKMVYQGSIMITYQPQKDKVNFFRMVVIHSFLDKRHMDYVLNKIEEFGKTVEV